MNNSSSDFLRYDITDIYHPLLSENFKEINETVEIRTRSLEVLRKELKNFKDLEPCLDEDYLLRFLRVSKYDTSKALQRIINYYKEFDVYLDVYKKLTIPFHKADSIRHLTVSPYRCRDNSILIIGKASIDYKKFSFAERFYLEIIALHQLLENQVNQLSGGTYVFDHEGMDIHGYLTFTPYWLRLFVNSLVNTYPCRLKAVHIVNTPSFYPLIWKVVYQFLPKKIKNRVFIHAKQDDWTHLHSYISPDILPEKYGGKLKQDDLIDCLHNLKELDETFLRFFAFGNVKTKKARQSMKVFQ